MSYANGQVDIDCNNNQASLKQNRNCTEELHWNWIKVKNNKMKNYRLQTLWTNGNQLQMPDVSRVSNA